MNTVTATQAEVAEQLAVLVKGGDSLVETCARLRSLGLPQAAIDLAVDEYRRTHAQTNRR